MTNPPVTGLRGVELGVPDLARAKAFYRDVWGLTEIGGDGDAVYLRGTGAEHHILTLRRHPRAILLGVDFAARDRAAVDRLHAVVAAHGATVLDAPAALSPAAGGGYGFRLRSPEGQPLRISADVARHDDAVADRSRPTKLTHVVLNSSAIDSELAFFCDALGFRLSDSTAMMEFVRCSRDHHSIALVRTAGPSLNHMAYEMPDIDGLMRGSGRMKQNGFNVEWGVGRHGPGHNVFSYFVEPNGFVAEYTAEVQQVDDSHVAHDSQYWETAVLRPCQWGMAGSPSQRLRAAMAGALLTGDDAEAERCEAVMARTLAR